MFFSFGGELEYTSIKKYIEKDFAESILRDDMMRGGFSGLTGINLL